MPDCNWFHCWWSIETPKEQTRRGRVSAAATWLRVASRPRLHEREKHPDNYAYFHIPLGVWHGGTLGSRSIEATKASRCWQLALIWVVQGGRGETALVHAKTQDMGDGGAKSRPNPNLGGVISVILACTSQFSLFCGRVPKKASSTRLSPQPGFAPGAQIRCGGNFGAKQTLM